MNGKEIVQNGEGAKSIKITQEYKEKLIKFRHRFLQEGTEKTVTVKKR
ncbi:MAG: hypothetical protein IKG27_03540 [Bacilli bacterium]|nr:hypothetical protein [Bacilli bacterium]